LTYIVKYHSRRTGKLLASSSDIPECEANKIIRKTFKYITATVERQPQ